MEERQKKLLEKRDQIVSTAPEIAEALKTTQLFSCEYIPCSSVSFTLLTHLLLIAKTGRSHSLIGKGRKRKYGEFKADHAMEEEKDGEVEELKTERDAMAQEIEDLRRKLHEAQKPSAFAAQPMLSKKKET